MKSSSIFVGCLLAGISTVAHGQTQAPQANGGDGLSVQEILAVSKITGACGIIEELLHFQQTTKMEGGDAFLVRFLQTEAARRGMTHQQIIEECNSSETLYSAMWKAAGE